MTLYKRGNIYWYQFWFKKSRIQHSTKQGSKTVARQIEAAHRTTLARGEMGLHDAKEVPRFRAAMADFLRWSEFEHAAHPATYKRYCTSSAALQSHFRDVVIDQINAEAVERFKQARLKQFKTVREGKGRKSTRDPISPATVNRELACLRMVFNHAIKAGIRLSNPVGKYGARQLKEQNQQTRVLSFKEQEEYLANASPTLRDIAELMLETGARPQEIYCIRVKDVRINEEYLEIPKGKTKASQRRIPLSQRAKEILIRRLQTADDYLFPCETDSTRPLPKINNAHDRALRDSKIAYCRLYDLRHTFSTRAAQAGVDPVTLAALLGHSKIHMVMRYTHPTQEHQVRAIQKLASYTHSERSRA